MKNKRQQEWHPQSAPSFWINHASRLLMRQFERQLRPLDFGMAYLPVVLALKEHKTLLQKDLAAHARVEQPTMAALLARMERDGLIVRTAHPDDKRAIQISLLAKARARLPRAQEALWQIADQAVCDFSERERATILKLLQRVVKNLEPEPEA